MHASWPARLPDGLDGRSKELTDFRGQVVFLNF
jgi:hypothetical protein